MRVPPSHEDTEHAEAAEDLCKWVIKTQIAQTELGKESTQIEDKPKSKAEHCAASGPHVANEVPPCT